MRIRLLALAFLGVHATAVAQVTAPDPTSMKCVHNDCGSSCDCYGPSTCYCATTSGSSSGARGSPAKIFQGNKTSNYTLQPKGSSSSSRRRSKWSPPSSYANFRDATRAVAAENWSAAITGFRSVLSYDRGNAAAYKGLGWSLLRSGKPAEAIPELRAALKLAPGDDQAKELLADALAANGASLLAAGDADGADAAFREAALLGDKAAKENAQRVADYRAAVEARRNAERLLSSKTAAGGAATSAAQHAAKALTLLALREEEAASEEARRPFDTAGELVVPVIAAPLAALPPAVAVQPGAMPPPPPSIPKQSEAAAKPLLDRRAAAEAKRAAAEAQVAALTPLSPSPERDAALAKAREVSDRATQERVFVDLALAGTIRAAAPAAPVQDCRDASARIARLDAGIASQEAALARTKVILDQAASDSKTARAEMRAKLVTAAKDELESLAGDFLSSTDALRAKTRALRALGLDRADRRAVLEAVKALEDGLDDAKSKWEGVKDFDKLVADAPSLQAKADQLLLQTRSLEEKLALLRNELVASGLADQAGEFLASRLAGPAGALAFRAARLAIDVSVLYGETTVAADLRDRAEQDYAILTREHERVIRMRDSLRSCAR